MKKMKLKKGVVLLLLITGVKSFSQRIQISNVANAQNNSVTNTGIFYGLPKSELVIKVEVTKVKFEKPKDGNLCEKLFGDCDAFFGGKHLPYQGRSAFKISDVNINTLAKIDPNQIYRVNAKRRWNRDKGLTFGFNPEGIITGAKLSNEDKTLDIVVSSIQSILQIVRSATFTNTTAKKAVPNVNLKEFELDLKNRILDLIQKREALITSPNYSGSIETLQYKIQELDKLIAKELIVVLGKKTVTKKVFTFVIDTPEKPGIYKLFSLVTSGGKSGINVDPTFANQTFIPNGFRTTVTVGNVDEFMVEIAASKNSLGELLRTKLANTTPKKKGMAYRVPGSINVTVFNGMVSATEKKQIFKGSFLIPQLGSIAYLPYKISTAEIEYYENLGWIKSVNITSKSITPDQINSVGKTINSVRNAVKGDSEVERLTKQIELLKLRKEYNELNNGTNE